MEGETTARGADKKMKTLTILIIGMTLLGLAQAAAAVDANQLHGGWETTAYRQHLERCFFGGA